MIESLNRHLNSPIHQQPLYHCPRNTRRREFISLAGLMNNLESERCGYTWFEDVQRTARSIMGLNRLLTFN
ncbi:hypothetical protein F5Y11DRAFT_330302 [Daldinia sp. FL1419]|nr:hypothetical protein F5Y11DRAFT_330302 [Daldinia sp. FL1419]